MNGYSMWLWSNGGGNSVFDPWSLHHIVFFIAITLILTSIFQKHIFLSILLLTITWEICEHILVKNIPTFPYIGYESFLNKCIGDPVSNFIGYFIALYLINNIKKGVSKK